jgi:endoglucanase
VRDRTSSPGPQAPENVTENATDTAPTTSGRRRSVRRSGLAAGAGAALTLALAATLAPALNPALDPGAATASSLPDAASATAARGTSTGNPLAGRRWGVYKGNADQSWAPYAASKGAERQLLAKISERPKAKWFGDWISNAAIGKKVDEYIANSTGGDPNVLVQMTMFRMQPWEHDACKRLPTRAEQASYKQWTDRAAAAIGSAHVAMVLQPDGPFALCAPGHSPLPSQLIAYSARKYAALPNTHVYIDAGASDWPINDPKKAANILVPAGIKYARGFAFNSTHYATTAREIQAGTAVVAELNRRGLRGKHFVINTSSNGRGFVFGTARGSHPDHANVCRTRSEQHCVTLGIPPTTNVASTRWGLSKLNRAKAARYVDAYLWFGRPWLYMQADPFDKPRALQLARTTPY